MSHRFGGAISGRRRAARGDSAASRSRGLVAVRRSGGAAPGPKAKIGFAKRVPGDFNG